MQNDTPMDSTAQTGSTNLPAGVDPAASAAPAEPSTPTVFELDENALIKPKGSEKPIKFGEYGRGLQSQMTKASQKAALLEKQLAERDAKLKALEQAQQQRQQQQNPAQQEDIYASLRTLPYLTGEDAVNVVQSIGEQLRQRDMVLLGALKEMQSMRQILNTLGETHTNQTFESKINGFITAGQHDPGWTDLAKEIYLAYEPSEELDAEFPQILASRIEQAEKILEARRVNKLNQAKKVPFVPGKGGTANPSKPLQIKPNASAREIADELFGSWNESGT